MTTATTEKQRINDPSMLYLFRTPDGRAARWQRPTTKQELADRFELFGLKLSPNVHPACVDLGHSAPLDVAWSIYSGTDYRTGKRAPVIVLKGSRGLSGKSTLLAGVSSIEGLEGYNGTVLGGSLVQSQNVQEISNKIWDRDIETDEAIYEGGLSILIDDPTAYQTKFSYSGAWRKVLTASSRQARGPHPHRLRMDEVDEMVQSVFDSAMGQTMSLDLDMPIQTAIASTHQHADGTMTYVLKEAATKGWPVYEFCYRECLRTEDRYLDVWKDTKWDTERRAPDDVPDGKEGGWLPMWLVVEKRDGVSVAMWNNEYELGEPSIEGRAIHTPAVEWTFDSSNQWLDGGRRGGPFMGDEGEYLEFPCCELYADNRVPCARGHRYITGADWAQTIDWTIIVTFRTDVSPWRLVAWERTGRKPWPVMLNRFNIRKTRYPGLAVHDATGMGGKLVSDFLEVSAEPFVMAGQKRNLLFTDYVVGVENHEIMCPRIMFAYDEHRLCTVKDLKQGGRADGGHPPDSVVANALAWSMRDVEFVEDLQPGGYDTVGPLDGLV